MRYIVVIEKADNNYAAYSPDVPGCVATGRTAADAFAEYKKALDIHLKGLREDGLPLPEPSAQVEYVVVSQGAAG
ncbi:MAG: type II toxin-antitoxin system HicB family antitoxin [Bacillota bacterium]|nr:type II toxin-antitoxin system HicB family antitoxin [Bacillota bacterium]